MWIRYSEAMRIARLLLPVVALLVMMFAHRNRTALTVSYVLFGLSGLIFLIAFVKDFRKPKKSNRGK